MTIDGAAAAESITPGALEVGDLRRIGDAFELGEIERATFLAEGLMNRNWRIETAAGGVRAQAPV